MTHLTCPKCGSNDHTTGFGLAAGPMGAYVYCNNCNELIDFKPDLDGMSDEFVAHEHARLDAHMKPMWGDKYDETTHALKPEAYNDYARG